ncbi:MAG: glycosyltransferase [Candidatus Brocadia sp.]|nr:MAG: glycosyltransferase [Candidatus Brocadia sp.]
MFYYETINRYMIQLSACLIVKNEAFLLPYCLDSIGAFVDEIIVVDTGSTDETIKIANKYKAKVSQFPWTEDFSAARNHSISCARGEWILYIDADEAIDRVNAGKIHDAIKRKDIMGITVRQCIPQRINNIATAYYSEYCRIFRRHKDVRFKGKIHEQILPSIERLGGKVLRTDIVFNHWAYGINEEKKRRRAERNLRYLLDEVENAPYDPFVYFNLGITYCELGKKDAAICSLQRTIDLYTGNIKRELIGQAHLWLAKLYLELDNFTKTEYHARMVSSYDPANPLSAYILATIAVVKEQYKTAIEHLEHAIQISKGETGLLPSVEMDLAQMYLELGSCRSASGDTLDAEKDFVRSLEYNPSGALPYVLLGNCRFLDGDKKEAEKMYERALAIDSSLVNASHGIELCRANKK